MESTTETYKTEAEVIARAKELIKEGYECIPTDLPEAAQSGYTLWKEDCVTVLWNIFGEKYEVDSAELSLLSEIFEFIHKEGWVLSADIPKELKFGFVRYDHEGKKAIHRWISISKAKGQVGIDYILGFQDGQLKASIWPFRTNRLGCMMAKLD